MSVKSRKNVSPAFKVYLEAQTESQKKHGNKTIVMMQMGSFLEMFHVKFSDGTELGKADDLDDLLSKMGEKKDQVGKVYASKEISSVSRYGFPFLAESKERYISIANKRGYTVPVYYQRGNEKDPITKIVPRFLGDTWTPTIRPNSYKENGSNEWFIGYLIDSGKQRNVSICAINAHTRSFKTLAFPNPSAGTNYIPESSDFLRINFPTEIILWVKGNNTNVPKLGIPEDIPLRKITIPNSDLGECVYDSVMNFVSNEYVLPKDIPEVVVRSFDFMMSTIPDVMLDTQYHLVRTNESDTMVLENHCLSQLNIIDPFVKSVSMGVRKKNRSVIGVVNQTQTHMGDRTIREWITNPSTSKGVIDYRTGLGNHLQSSSLEWDGCLKGMADLDCLFSSEVLGGLSYKLLMDCISTITRFIEYDTKEPLMYHSRRVPVPTEEIKSLLQKIGNELVNPDTLPYNGSVVGGGILNAYSDPCEIEFPFTEAYANTIGRGSDTQSTLWDDYQEYHKAIQILKNIERDLNLDLGYVNNTYVLWVTGGKKGTVKSSGQYWRNAEKVESKNAKGRYELDGETRINHNGKFDVLVNIIKTANHKRNQVSHKTRTAWIDWSKNTRTTYENLISVVSRLIGETDAALSGVKCVRKYGYSYASVNGDSSYYRVEGLRHPLIESIQQDVAYVPHTMSITESKRGRLLFGVNSSGKSSLMKAVGISIILAQAGLPVPARSMDLGVYHSLFTRILGNDNLFQGMSTFAVEASELLRILKTSTHRSMVLGDELCSGTEQYGAEAIVASSILTLLKRNVSFVFATHWHRLRDLPDLRSHPSLVWNHLRVDCDESGRMIMYRTLQDGPGPRGYAIEYMKNMGADIEMIEGAIKIRSRITSEEFALQSVRSWNGGGEDTAWNSKARINSVCEICKTNPTEETDHIIPRENAHNDGGIQGYGSVHHGSNLVGLCKGCHQKKTRGLIKILGYKESMGKGGIRENILEWEYVQNDINKEDEDPVKELIVRFSASGSSVRQVQNIMKRNGYKVSQSLIRETLKE